MPVKIDSSKCIGCRDCIPACPMDAIVLESGKVILRRDCIDCGSCISTCQKGAISES
jgi:NAD-dependent dihydropyrimidine dehydrogenase PreA subunit